MKQSVFMRGRSLHDNFVLVRQVARRINQRRNTGVLLKRDISRAFGCISWAFLTEVLRHLGFGTLFFKWVGHLLYTELTRITVNGVPGARIKHARGLQQGDPTSPPSLMLYVIGMEVLTLIVKKAVDEQILSGLAGITPLQRVSIYAGDVVLIFKVEERELLVIRHT
jgi:hypothetical protein